MTQNTFFDEYSHTIKKNEAVSIYINNIMAFMMQVM